jgi:hypothetical protein
MQRDLQQDRHRAATTVDDASKLTPPNSVFVTNDL